MSLDLIHERLEAYSISSKYDEENAVKEICQEIALAGLSRSGFFKNAAFQGGTCLRILYGLRRFSEDLDFILLKSQENFAWHPFLQAIDIEFQSFGLSCDVVDRSGASSVIKKAFLKEDSFGQVLKLRFKRGKSDLQKIMIKLEIDTNPPAGSTVRTHFLEYPYPLSIVSQDESSLFASKCHALLSREYVKGRDWYDFIWYVQRKSKINFDLLKNALEQCGPYKGTFVPMSTDWLKEQLIMKVDSIDWNVARTDVEKFISLEDKRFLDNWSKEMFIAIVEKLPKEMLSS
jgi:predicted nucleotidyltransferase component of viral defense system